ncbi:NAD(P)-dependent oxidoreductase [Microlunatus sp. Gsoil 973]|uniref:NAD-dependent epimerase/dehydratase family protein n=1 Tax=Microlunatus sp. Gsoil 973 TaxID=2672569 RepID=UPI0012B4767C|nr:NAD-dependent epimerase/dehydratase family protein [Microlunatus sp. Gsoil 973]QGN31498.1 NAD(P)H-binding protein [Microlunatus sp. Gsoil 973]
MRIFLAGGTGVLGSRLIPGLVAAGHDVAATTRRPERRPMLGELGAAPVVVDVYDADRLRDAVTSSAPELILHELTDLSDMDTDANARLRREGTANLVAAAEAAGVQRIIVQSIAWVFPDGTGPATEDEQIIHGSAVEVMEQTARRLPHATILRYGMLYGPRTWYAPGGRMADRVVAGRLPATPEITNFVHIDDAVAATVSALDWPDGTYHIVDDEPAAGTEWLPAFAAAIGAPQPQQAPVAEGARRGRPVSNAKARAAGWRPVHPTWRDGFGSLTGN